MMKYVTLLIFGFIVVGCTSPRTTSNERYTSEKLAIQKITDHVYQHTSFLHTESFGKVACSGMIVFDKNEAIIFDTPTDENASLELINWVEDNLKCKVKAIIPTHFHTDCLGGLEEFHKHQVPSYANNLTIELAEANHSAIPQNGFDNLLELKAGSKTVLARYFGEGHTKDNVIGYVPDERVMFGGCLIKELGAGKGNLEDANVDAWPMTVTNLKDEFPDAKVVIPGHGKIGGTDLFDYTITLFGQK